jgi:hypothetical protein
MMRAILAAVSALGLLACGGHGASSSTPNHPLPADAVSGNAGSSGVAFDVQAHLLASAAGAKSEGTPVGVPAQWDWVAGATPARTTAPGPQYTHANYWGAIFRGTSDTTPPNSMLQVRACSMWFLLEGNPQWLRAEASTELDGSTFSPTYAGGGPAPLWLAPQATGIDVIPAEGHIYHFWQQNGYQPLPQQVREILTNCQARVAARDAAEPDDSGEADYLIHVGADFRDPTDPSCANDKYICPSWGVSRLERVAIAWRNHTFHSLTQVDLSAGVPLPPVEIFQFDE